MIDLQKLIFSKYPYFKRVPSIVTFPLFAVAKKLIHQKDINDFLKQHGELSAFEFIEEVLEYFDFTYKFTHNQIENIPKTGRVVIIANHPLGALDALSLIDAIKNVRTDIKVVANSLLNSINPLKDILIDVDPFENKISKDAMKLVYNSLEKEEAVIVFPSGEVSRARLKGVSDLKWHKGFLKFAKKSRSPLLPIFINSRNSLLFYIVSSINTNLAIALLPGEMYKKRGKFLEFKIGKIIPYKSFTNTHLDIEEEVRLFKRHVYNLSRGKEEIFETEKPIAHPVERQEIIRELKKCKILGETTDKKQIFLYNYEKGDFAILKEMGRLREYTFRKVEEGTGERVDTDSYDKYYEHIILWDRDELEIVGCYRIGKGSYIMKYYGIDGFYSNSLFRFDTSFEKYLCNSIELGRSFVQPKYWGSRALDYLWQGIGAYLAQNPTIKYMFGPVSLSGALSKDALNLIVAYYKHYYGSSGSLVESRVPFVINRNEKEEINKVFTFKDKTKDFLILRKQLKLFNTAVPTLYKQYTELCEDGGIEFLGFNIDKDFNNCVDGLILVDIAEIRPNKKERYIKY
ncbi:Putative hemolysin [hydrothermal vent metagenome]|uniref:Putative hemolysin n=1 Tax=hydrothermal vent metagenome TaxID=652676 RepID=A0A1W1BKN9_9ZZZZ